jgi:hypothetical protein
VIERLKMSYHDAATPDDAGISADEPFGPLVFHTALPCAIRSLDDTELRILLIALLQEWRIRAEWAGK